MTNNELMAMVADPSYLDMQVKGDAGIVAILPLFYTHAIIAGICPTGYEDRWCYADYDTAKAALDAWDGSGEPTGWHRHPTSGRRVDANGLAYVER